MKPTNPKSVIRCMSWIICVFMLLFYYSPGVQTLINIPTDIYVAEGDASPFLTLNEPFKVSGDGEVSVSSSFDQRISEVTVRKINSGKVEHTTLDIDLFGLIPVKTVNVHVMPPQMVAPGGKPIGVTIHMKGVLVVGTSNLIQGGKEVDSPAALAGIRAGDMILKANGTELTDSAQLSVICQDAPDGVMDLEISRNGEIRNVTLRAQMDEEDQQYRMGMWVRDSTSGIGTLSFFDPVTKRFGALGHAVNDIDTSTTLSVRKGELIESEIVGATPGAQGKPGELHGSFHSGSKRLGTIEENTEYGIFGTLYGDIGGLSESELLEIAYPSEAKLGSAYILSTVDGGGVTAYECNIVKIFSQSSPAQKGMVIEITDEKLLSITGGIVQGMSGSPLIQNGKLLGVVTHVFINNPQKGYCMYALWMNKEIFD